MMAQNGRFRFANHHSVERVSNALPVVEAGAAIAVDAGNADCELSRYTYNCADCADVTVQLETDSGVSDADGDPLTYQWYVMSGDATLSDPIDVSTLHVWCESRLRRCMKPRHMNLNWWLKIVRWFCCGCHYTVRELLWC